MTGGKHENMKAWAPEEDQVILEQIENGGHQWSKIVQRLPGRTVSSVRNRWQRMEKGRTGLISKNRCHQCGQLKRGHTCVAKLKGGPHVQLSSRALPPNPLAGLTFPTMSAPLRERLHAPSDPNIFIDSAATRATSPDSLTVDVSVATPTAKSAIPLPPIQRFNSSSYSVSRFAASELQSPSMRDLYAKLFDSPREFTPRARPAELQVAGGEPQPPQPPQLPQLPQLPLLSRSRSLTSFMLGEMPLGAAAAAVAGSLFAPLPPPVVAVSSFSGTTEASTDASTEAMFTPLGIAESRWEGADELPLAPPPVVRKKSSGLPLNDLADIFGLSEPLPMVAC